MAGLEDILNAQAKCKTLTGIAEACKDGKAVDVIKPYLDYLNTYGPLTDDEKAAYYRKTQFQFLRDLTGDLKGERTALVQATAANFDKAMKAIPEKALFSVLYQLPPAETKDEEHNAIAQLQAQYMESKARIDNGDPSLYLKNLEARNEKAYKSFKKDFSPEELLTLAKSHASQIKKVLESAFTYQEGKNKGKLNASALKTYITNNINAYDDNLKAKAYEIIGNNVRGE
jgi:hypothetical protein